MALTLGSWWQNPRTGQRMVVSTYGCRTTSSFNPETKRYVSHGLGRPLDRHPCFLEGTGLYLAWLTAEEVRGGWKPYRPPKLPGVLPSWVRESAFNDYDYVPRDPGCIYWVGVQGVRSGWFCLSGVSNISKLGESKEEAAARFDWGTQTYDTFFVPIREATPHMTPKYEKRRPSIWERLEAEEGERDAAS